MLKTKIFTISAANRFETVVTFLRKKLAVRREESVICYVNSVFAPGLDEGVGGLWKVCSLFYVLENPSSTNFDDMLGLWLMDAMMLL